MVKLCCCFFQAEDGIRDLVRSRGLGDVYKRQRQPCSTPRVETRWRLHFVTEGRYAARISSVLSTDCLLYTSDAADDLLCVDLGGRRIIKKKKH